jgi:hypothetical protein
LAGLVVDVEYRATVPVVHEDGILGRLEDRTVAGLGLAQRRVGAYPL